VELLGKAAAHARRVEEVPLELRYHLQARESRFRPVRALRELMAVRGMAWPTPDPEKTT
jgi:hypothetical protein